MTTGGAWPDAVPWSRALRGFRHELANALTLGLGEQARVALERDLRDLVLRVDHAELEPGRPVAEARRLRSGCYDLVWIRGASGDLGRIANEHRGLASRGLCLELADAAERPGERRSEGLAAELRGWGAALAVSAQQVVVLRSALDAERLRATLRGDAASPPSPGSISILTQRPAPRPGLARRLRRRLRDGAGRLGLRSRGAAAPATRAAPPGGGGPGARGRALRRGLEQLGQPYAWNPPPEELGPLVHALCGTAGLGFAIEVKRRGGVRRLVAGPNVSALPHDDGGLIAAPEIDRILFASPWIRDWFQALDASIAARSAIWPAGVDLRDWRPHPELEPSIDFLILEKLDVWTVPIAEEHRGLSAGVQRALEERGHRFEVLRYGDFDRSKYEALLSRCRGMLYLSLQETQSIAIAEAWAAGVPVLVWSQGRAGWRGHYFDGASSCPYGDDRARRFFRGLADFEAALDDFVAGLEAGSFQPRSYAAEHLSLRATTERYLSVWRELLASS